MTAAAPGPSPTIYTTRGALRTGPGVPGSREERDCPPGAPGPRPRAGSPSPRRCPGRPPPPPQARPRPLSHPTAFLSAPGCRLPREPAPRAPHSRRQQPGKRRRRRLPGPRPLGPRPGAAGSRLSGRAGPPPTDSQPDCPTDRKAGRKNRPTDTLRLIGPGLPSGAPTPPSSSLALLPPLPPPPKKRRCPTAAPRPPLPHSPRPATTLAPASPPHPSGVGPSLARQEKWAEPGQEKLPNQRRAVPPASLSPPLSFPQFLYAVSRPLGAAG
ncbi:BBSome-interacting protein 1 isoform X1 [Pan paniscus]|uniref:BBSome-interacting protein 1 isoform X1 n=1 Tax=Pan paniscus TaxID=9597 RepID=UPI00300543A6